MPESFEKDNTDIIINSKKWVAEFVIGLGLCPFAKSPFINDRIRFVECSTNNLEKWIEIFIEECNNMVQSDAKELSTTLIIYPFGLEDFYSFLDIIETFQEMLEKSDLDDIIQLASFHPLYQFEGANEDDVSNYTNRSPYPIVHLLRVDEVEQAILRHGDTDKIPLRNQNLMQKLGEKKIKTNYLQNLSDKNSS